MNFKKNIHIAKKYTLEKTNDLIKNYNKKYKPPKYLLFIKEMLENGFKVKVYVAKVSKYVFLIKGEEIIKVRFSNHKPLYEKEEEGDCDYYVGISHKQVITTENLTKQLLKNNIKK